MEQRQLGKSGLKVSALGLGLMSMSGIYGNANDEESIGAIHHAIDKGITFLDSADMYGWGHNETLLGKALKGAWRAKAIVATKFGQVKLPDGKQGVDGTPDYVAKACEASLKRLGIEVIDLYYQHRVDPNTPIEDTVGAMKRLVEQGKVRALGLSEPTRRPSAARTRCIPSRRCRTSTRCFIARKARKPCKRAASSASRSFPTPRSAAACSPARCAGKGGPARGRPPARASAASRATRSTRTWQLVSKLKPSPREALHVPQLALAWVLAQGKDIVPIPAPSAKSASTRT
jgi:aryl-alcohol dehydrogenase-like predicted oxidoreductase